MKLDLALLVSSVVTVAAGVRLGTPSGRYAVGSRQYLLDHITPDDPSPGDGKQIMVTVYYPTHHRPAHDQPYMDPANAKLYEGAWGYPNGSLLMLETVLQPDAPFLADRRCSHLPTLLFSPGFSINGFMYYSLNAEMASHGYTTIIVDHPGDPPLLVLSDGTNVPGFDVNFVPGNNSFYETVDRYRVSDALAVLDDFPGWVEANHAPINTAQYIAWGHSVGGGAAAGVVAAASAAGSELGKNKTSVLGGIDLDGAFFGAQDVKRPFLTFLNINHTATPWYDPSLSEFYSAQTSWWEALSLYGSAHYNFPDFALMLEVLGLEGRTTTPNIGFIGAARALKVVNHYVRHFFEFLTGGSDHIFLHPSLEWREVGYVNGSAF